MKGRYNKSFYSQQFAYSSFVILLNTFCCCSLFAQRQNLDTVKCYCLDTAKTVSFKKKEANSTNVYKKSPVPSQSSTSEVKIENNIESSACYRKDLPKDDSQSLFKFLFDKVFPDLLWIIFWLMLFYLFKKYIFSFCDGILNRIKHGSGVKIGAFELEGLNIGANEMHEHLPFQITDDTDGIWNKERSDVYANQRGAMLVHKIYKSHEEGQLYDLAMYIIPHTNSSLVAVSSVQYFFGRMWKSKIFESRDRSNGFPIVASAYGPFLCLAKLNFNDGTSTVVSRYIDFEMGAVAPIAITKSKTK